MNSSRSDCWVPLGQRQSATEPAVCWILGSLTFTLLPVISTYIALLLLFAILFSTELSSLLHSAYCSCVALCFTSLHFAFSSQCVLLLVIRKVNRRIVKRPQLFDINHADPRKGSRGHVKALFFFDIDHASPRRGSQSRAMTTTHPPALKEESLLPISVKR